MEMGRVRSWSAGGWERGSEGRSTEDVPPSPTRMDEICEGGGEIGACAVCVWMDHAHKILRKPKS